MREKKYDIEERLIPNYALEIIKQPTTVIARAKPEAIFSPKGIASSRFKAGLAMTILLHGLE